MLDVYHVTSRIVPGPSAFQRAALKSWEWPGDEATRSDQQGISITIADERIHQCSYHPLWNSIGTH